MRVSLFIVCMIAFLNPAFVGADTLVVLNKAEATASLIDLETDKVVATVPTGTGPHEVSVSSDGNRAVVCNYGTREEAGSSLTVIDVPSAKVQKTISLGEYKRPHGIQWLAGGRKVIVTAEENQAVIVVDIDEGKVVQSIGTGQEISHMVAVTPDGSRAFVANIGSGTVTVLDLVKGTRVQNIATGEGAEGIDITPDGKQVWVTNRAADSVSVLNAGTLEVLSVLESKSFPIRVKITPNGKWALVSNARSGDIAVFDVESRKEVRRITIPLESRDQEGRLFGGQFGKSSVPIGILMHPSGKRAYVAHANADSISVLDLEKWERVESLTAGKEPDGLGYSKLKVQSSR